MLPLFVKETKMEKIKLSKINFVKDAFGNSIGTCIASGWLLNILVKPKLIDGMKYYDASILSKTQLWYKCGGVSHGDIDMTGDYSLKGAKEMIQLWLEQISTEDFEFLMKPRKKNEVA